jgi:hypothetical protein
MHRAELIGLLNQSNLREKLEKCLADQSATTGTESEAACAGEAGAREFEKEVHSWNSQNLIFSRSPKE